MSNTAYDKKWWDDFREEAAREVLDLMKKKNEDYSHGESPFANFDASAAFGIDPLVGLGLRMGDKFARLQAFCARGSLALDEEGDTVRDIFKDLIGYSLLALGMIERAEGQDCDIDLCDVELKPPLQTENCIVCHHPVPNEEAIISGYVKDSLGYEFAAKMHRRCRDARPSIGPHGSESQGHWHEKMGAELADVHRTAPPVTIDPGE